MVQYKLNWCFQTAVPKVYTCFRRLEHVNHLLAYNNSSLNFKYFIFLHSSKTQLRLTAYLLTGPFQKTSCVYEEASFFVHLHTLTLS
jgi:hypothetical protein